MFFGRLREACLARHSRAWQLVEVQKNSFRPCFIHFLLLKKKYRKLIPLLLTIFHTTKIDENRYILNNK